MYKCMLSIYVTTYNHEKFIVRALDSIFSQKTQYTYEVLVGEDCSTDKTRELLKQYEKTHSEYILDGRLRIFYRDHNMYCEKPNNAADLKMRCQGKYMIALEGDDYWTDENKIESQIQFLESHPKYIAVAHNCQIVDEHDMPTGEKYPECKDEEYTLAHFISNILPGQLTTVMYRNIHKEMNVDTSLIDTALMPVDQLVYLTLILHGRIYCMQKSMSAYRHITSYGSSYSANFQYKFQTEEAWVKAIVAYMRKFKSPYDKYGESLYIRCLMKALRAGQCTLNEVYEHIQWLDHKCYALFYWIMYKFRKDILHQKKWI